MECAVVLRDFTATTIKGVGSVVAALLCMHGVISWIMTDLKLHNLKWSKQPFVEDVLPP